MLKLFMHSQLYSQILLFNLYLVFFKQMYIERIFISILFKVIQPILSKNSRKILRLQCSIINTSRYVIYRLNEDMYVY